MSKEKGGLSNVCVLYWFLIVWQTGLIEKWRHVSYTLQEQMARRPTSDLQSHSYDEDDFTVEFKSNINGLFYLKWLTDDKFYTCTIALQYIRVHGLLN